MSWEYSKYEAHCEACGRKGVCIEGSDDWGRSSTSWRGFGNRAPDPSAVIRKKMDSRDSIPVCICGNTRVIIGSYIKDL